MERERQRDGGEEGQRQRETERDGGRVKRGRQREMERDQGRPRKGQTGGETGVAQASLFFSLVLQKQWQRRGE